MKRDNIKLLFEIRFLLIKLLHCRFDVIGNPRRAKSFKWTVKIEHATLESFKDSIRKMYKPPALKMMEQCFLTLFATSGNTHLDMTERCVKCSRYS
jgi:hypothetical protein